MGIFYGDIVALYAHAIPGFEVSEGDLADPLPYIFMYELMTFVCERTTSSQTREAERFASILEILAEEGDEVTQYLVVDVLEGMRKCQAKDYVAEYFGAKISALWKRIGDPRYRPDDPSNASFFGPP